MKEILVGDPGKISVDPGLRSIALEGAANRHPAFLKSLGVPVADADAYREGLTHPQTRRIAEATISTAQAVQSARREILWGLQGQKLKIAKEHRALQIAHSSGEVSKPITVVELIRRESRRTINRVRRFSQPQSPRLA